MKAVKPVLPNCRYPEVKEMVLAETQPQYKALPVARVQYSDKTISMISCYQLSLRERIKLLFTGKVWWEQLTFGDDLQPQLMSLTEPLR